MTALLKTLGGGIAGAGLLFTVQAGEVQSVAVKHSDGRYSLKLSMWIDGDPVAVRRIATDYRQLDRISSIVIESCLLEKRDDNSQRRKIVTNACVWLFCLKTTLVEDVFEPTPDIIMTTIVPEYSDYSYGQMRWQILPHAEGTLIHFTGVVDPDFWVPPIIGPWLIKQKMRSEAEKTIQAIERLAHDD